MALRSSWKGFIKLSLVSVPVRAFTANATGAEVRLNQLHAACNNRVQYKKVCPDHGELSTDEIVSGYEYANGQYVVIDVDELDKLRTKNDRSIHIQGFLPPDSLDPIYHAGKTYYLLPDGAVGQKPYALLREGMLSEGVSALAKVVISRREQLVLMRVIDGLLVLTVLNHQDKVKSGDAFKDELADEKVVEDELNLTKTLIAASRMRDFDYGAYKDEYVVRLTELIQKKVEGQEVVQVPDPEEPKIINLMDALKKSVAEASAALPEEVRAEIANRIQGQASGPAQDKKKAAGKAKKATAKKATKKKKVG